MGKALRLAEIETQPLTVLKAEKTSVPGQQIP